MKALLFCVCINATIYQTGPTETVVRNSSGHFYFCRHLSISSNLVLQQFIDEKIALTASLSCGSFNG